MKSLSDGVFSCFDNVAAVVVFGSFAREEKFKDIDLLVVLEDIKKGELERIPEIIKIRKAVKVDLPLETLLLSKEECIANIKAHNPLFLDIAFDGLIVFDKDHWLTPLLTDLKNYVRNQGIKRRADVWYFPVKWREPSLLSPLSNKDWADTWIADAEKDLKAAQVLHTEELYDRCVTHCEQAVEKVIKAILICFGVLKEKHYVSSLLKEEIEKREIEGWKDKLVEISQIGEELEPEYIPSHYVRAVGDEIHVPSDLYDKELSQNFLEKANRAVRLGKEFVDFWFRRLAF